MLKKKNYDKKATACQALMCHVTKSCFAEFLIFAPTILCEFHKWWRSPQLTLHDPRTSLCHGHSEYTAVETTAQQQNKTKERWKPQLYV